MPSIIWYSEIEMGAWVVRSMTLWTVRKLCGISDLRCNGWAWGTEIQKISIQKPLKEKRRTVFLELWMGMETGVILMKALQMWLFLISQSSIVTSHLSRITEVTNAILTRVSEEMNQDLIKEFTKEEDQRVHYGGS